VSRRLHENTHFAVAIHCSLAWTLNNSPFARLTVIALTPIEFAAPKGREVQTPGEDQNHSRFYL
jgi:hypothetical protein